MCSLILLQWKGAPPQHTEISHMSLFVGSFFQFKGEKFSPLEDAYFWWIVYTQVDLVL